MCFVVVKNRVICLKIFLLRNISSTLPVQLTCATCVCACVRVCVRASACVRVCVFVTPLYLRKRTDWCKQRTANARNREYRVKEKLPSLRSWHFPCRSTFVTKRWAEIQYAQEVRLNLASFNPYFNQWNKISAALVVLLFAYLLAHFP